MTIALWIVLSTSCFAYAPADEFKDCKVVSISTAAPRRTYANEEKYEVIKIPKREHYSERPYYNVDTHKWE